MDYTFRRAEKNDAAAIWKILQQAISRRKQDGSQQWQDGYPNENVVQNDIEKGFGYVLEADGKIAGYAAVLFNDEPAYSEIEGKWLTDGAFAVVHRIAVADSFIGQGIAKKLLTAIEGLAIQNKTYSIKCDTNFDNGAMLAIFEKLGYTYCGEVYFRGSARKAYEKTLN